MQNGNKQINNGLKLVENFYSPTLAQLAAGRKSEERQAIFCGNKWNKSEKTYILTLQGKWNWLVPEAELDRDTWNIKPQQSIFLSIARLKWIESWSRAKTNPCQLWKFAASVQTGFFLDL